MNFYHHGCHTEPICSPQPCHHTVNQLDCILDKMTAIQLNLTDNNNPEDTTDGDTLTELANKVDALQNSLSDYLTKELADTYYLPASIQSTLATIDSLTNKFATIADVGSSYTAGDETVKGKIATILSKLGEYKWTEDRDLGTVFGKLYRLEQLLNGSLSDSGTNPDTISGFIVDAGSTHKSSLLRRFNNMYNDIYSKDGSVYLKIQDALNNSVTVDDDFNAASTNPVQNKIVYRYISNLTNILGQHTEQLSAFATDIGTLYSDVYSLLTNSFGVGSFDNIATSKGNLSQRITNLENSNLNITVDAMLNATSTNPVLNKVVWDYINLHERYGMAIAGSNIAALAYGVAVDNGSEQSILDRLDSLERASTQQLSATGTNLIDEIASIQKVIGDNPLGYKLLTTDYIAPSGITSSNGGTIPLVSDIKTYVNYTPSTNTLKVGENTISLTDSNIASRVAALEAGVTSEGMSEAVADYLATHGVSVQWSSVTNKPSFATVATSGSYDDLTNKPTIDDKLRENSAHAVENGVLTHYLSPIIEIICGTAPSVSDNSTYGSDALETALKKLRGTANSVGSSNVADMLISLNKRNIVTLKDRVLTVGTQSITIPTSSGSSSTSSTAGVSNISIAEGSDHKTLTISYTQDGVDYRLLYVTDGLNAYSSSPLSSAGAYALYQSVTNLILSAKTEAIASSTNAAYGMTVSSGTTVRLFSGGSVVLKTINGQSLIASGSDTDIKINATSASSTTSYSSSSGAVLTRGSSMPTSATPGDFFYNTSNNGLYMCLLATGSSGGPTWFKFSGTQTSST